VNRAEFLYLAEVARGEGGVINLPVYTTGGRGAREYVEAFCEWTGLGASH
jgi:hypothetical protein